ncbi:hypothetical protein F9K91_21160 [Brucella tritici]|uniref:Scaffolding protein n=1 Tax=Brucella tritici TaxID=94626 RepID=A0A7X6JB28_9HYPH|nr:hypothetical protein [Brucella tritici]KAB2662747.1 hypothetical protein F9K91_21160 [Brucella tritici]NKW09132.1 hypothetical protein [Brucella tritici]
MTAESADFDMGGGNQSLTIEMGEGADGSETIKRNDHATIEFNTDDVRKENDEGELEGTLEDDDGDNGEGDASTTIDTDGDNEGEDTGEDLGAFDPEDQEVVSRFDARYLDADGDLDLEGALNKEFWDNAAKGKEGLNEATYEYLKSKGIKQSTIKQVEAMALTQKDSEEQGVKAQDQKLFSIAGGPDKLKEALAWGKAGGYTKEQQARFNQITSGTDLAAKEEAVEALMSRFSRANPTPKPKLPKRNATNGQGGKGPSVKPFKDRAEMRAMRDGLRDNDVKGWAQYNARLRATKDF